MRLINLHVSDHEWAVVTPQLDSHGFLILSQHPRRGECKTRVKIYKVLENGIEADMGALLLNLCASALYNTRSSSETIASTRFNVPIVES